MSAEYAAPVDAQNVLVGVGVIILRDNRILLGKRKGSHGADTWAPPGGHLDFGETVEECARREVFEETGIVVSNIVRGPYTSNVFPEVGKHYITLFVIAQASAGEPELREPSKCQGWEWHDWHHLPAPLFAALQSLRDSGFTPQI